MRPSFNPEIIRDKFGGGRYASEKRAAPTLASLFPSVFFYVALAKGPVQWLFRKGEGCDDASWVYASSWCGDEFEKCGGSMVIEGLENLRAVDGPCVVVANHMSTYETFLLPAIIRPIKRVTFVVKKSLVSTPLFGPVMRSRDPVVVGRENPREDLAAVLTGGAERLNKGVSVVVFPQHTRSAEFDEAKFNSIGVKLAARAGVPIVPLALKTDAWGNGKLIKELGRIRPDLPARFAFGEPMPVSGTGKAEHRRICEFIKERVNAWQTQDGVNK